MKKIFFVFLPLLILGGCSTTKQEQFAALNLAVLSGENQEPMVYKPEGKEEIGKVAEKLYGDKNKAHLIVEQNPHLKNQKHIDASTPIVVNYEKLNMESPAVNPGLLTQYPLQAPPKPTVVAKEEATEFRSPSARRSVRRYPNSIGSRLSYFIVQMGAFRDIKNAKRILDILHLNKIPANISAQDHNRLGTLYKVQLSSAFDSREDAHDQATSVRRQTAVETCVAKYP